MNADRSNADSFVFKMIVNNCSFEIKEHRLDRLQLDLCNLAMALLWVWDVQ